MLICLRQLVRLCASLALGFALVATTTWTYGARAANGSAPKPKTTAYLLNGYDVLLVDMKAGNQFGYVFAVPYGSADDPPEQFGRAHFFEHMFARGSNRFPGHETLIQAMTGFGFDRNAATGLSFTFYYAHGSEAQGLKAMNMHLAALDEIELEASSLKREKATVINEVIESRPNKPAGSIHILPMVELLRDGHPLKGHHVGTHATLDPMSADDLRALHRAVYVPGRVRIAVFGNFTSGQHKPADVIRQLEASLPEHKPRVAPLKYQRPDPLFAGLKDRVLEIKSTNDKVGTLLFELPATSNPTSVETFLDVLTSQQRNSLRDILVRKLGLVRSLAGGVSRVGGAHVATIYVNFTDQGFAVRDQVMAAIMSAAEKHKNAAFPEELLSYFRQSATKSGESMQHDISGLLSLFAEWMTHPGNDAKLTFDWQKAAADCNATAIAEGVQSLLQENSAVVYFGPNTLPTLGHDDIFNVDFAKREMFDVAQPSLDLTYDPTKIVVADAQLTSIDHAGEQPLRREQWRRESFEWSEVLSHNTDWHDRSLYLNFNFGRLMPLEQLALQALVRGFTDELGPELANLGSRGIEISVGSGSSELTFHAQGNVGDEVAALIWAIEKFAQFRPNQNDLDRFVQTTRDGFRRHEQDFPGQIAIQVTQSLLSPQALSQIEKNAVLSKLTLAHLIDFQRSMLPRANKLFGLAGEIYPSEEQALRAEIGLLFPTGLGIETDRSVPQLSLPAIRLVHAEPWLDDAQSGVGVVRVIPAPNPNEISERAALGIVRSLLHQQIFLLNRPLGYVQGTALMAPASREHFIAFMGQASDAEKALQLEAVWDSEVQRWLSRKVTVEEIEKARKGLLDRLRQRPSTSSDDLGDRIGHLRTNGNPNYGELMKLALEKLTIDEVFATADRYLSPTNPRLTVKKGDVKKGDLVLPVDGVPASSATGLPETCDDILSARRALRSLLKAK